MPVLIIEPFHRPISGPRFAGLHEENEEFTERSAPDPAVTRDPQGPVRLLRAGHDSLLPIPGSGSPEHVQANVAAASIELSADEVAAITRGG